MSVAGLGWSDLESGTSPGTSQSAAASESRSTIQLISSATNISPTKSDLRKGLVWRRNKRSERNGTPREGLYIHGFGGVSGPLSITSAVRDGQRVEDTRARNVWFSSGGDMFTIVHIAI